jgi:hypothetical protein
MVDEHTPQAKPVSDLLDRLTHISEPTFVAAWKALVGEPPASMLESRSEMIRLLVASSPIAEPARTSVIGWD